MGILRDCAVVVLVATLFVSLFGSVDQQTRSSTKTGAAFSQLDGKPTACSHLREFLNFSLIVEGFHPTADHDFNTILEAALIRHQKRPFSSESLLEFLCVRLSSVRGETAGSLRLEAGIHREHEHELNRLLAFLMSLRDSVLRPRYRIFDRRRSAGLRDDALVRAVVVGGGPIGLLSAITAFKSGINVSVVEMRLNYTRDGWFDLYDEPWYRTCRTLDELGFASQSKPFHPHGEGQSYTVKTHPLTVRTQILERFLAKVLVALGVTMSYGWEVLTMCSGVTRARPYIVAHNVTEQHTAEELDSLFGAAEKDDTFWCHVDMLHAKDSFRKFPFDVVIAADGAHSRLRKVARIPFVFQKSFLLPNGQRLTTEETLRQTTLIVDFNTLANGSCPTVQTNPVTGEPYDAYDVAFEVPGVSCVFKRFYNSNCQLQILFEHDFGDSLLDLQQWGPGYRARNDQQFWVPHHLRSEEDSERGVHPNVPWDTLLQIMNFQFVHKFDTVADLQRAIHQISETSNADIYHSNQVIEGPQWTEIRPDRLSVKLFDISIGIAKTHVAYIDELIDGVSTQIDDRPPSSYGNEPRSEKMADVKPSPRDVLEKLTLTVDLSKLAEDGTFASEPLANQDVNNIRPLILFMGDSAATAHFRLGIGVNRAFHVEPIVYDFLSALAIAKESSDVSSAYADYSSSMEEEIQMFADLQVSTMFYEAYCNYLVSLDTEQPLMKAQRMLRKIKETKEFKEVTTMAEFMEHCRFIQD